MVKQNYAANKKVSFEQQPSIEAVDAAIYGGVDIPPSGRVLIRPVDIMTIYPDLAQPRRAIPLSVRGNWDGSPDGVMDVLTRWWQTTEWALDMKIDVPGILKGHEQGENGLVIPEGKASAEAFIELLRLGASIFAEGLTNAITVASRGERLQIETGERRWLAHHLLNHFVSDKFGKIPAREVTYDRFRQASENNNRRKLTAIEMARQLAILLMDMYEGDKDVNFDSIEALTFDGCDRRYYAQVAHGRVWKIKDGFGERMQAAMGLPSLDRVADYRKILRPTDDEALNDQIWMQADDENWTEFYIRTYVDDLKKQASVGRESNTPTDETDTSTWASVKWIQQWAYASNKPVWVIAAVSADVVDVIEGDGNTIKPGAEPKQVNISALTPVVRIPSQPITPGKTLTSTPQTKTATLPPLTDKFGKPITIGAKVKTHSGHIGTVTNLNRPLVDVDIPGNAYAGKGIFASSVEVLPEELQTADVPEELQGKNYSTAGLIGKAVIFDGKAALVVRTKDSENVVIRQGGTELVVHKNLLTVNPSGQKQKLTEVVTPQVEDETDDTDTLDTVPVSDVDPRLIIRSLADMASILELPEFLILEDLTKLNKQGLEAIINDGGYGVLQQLTDGYYKAATDAANKIEAYIHAYIAEIVATGREMTKED